MIALRTLEKQGEVVLVAVKTKVLQGCVGREIGAFEVDRVIVTAGSVLPNISGMWSTASTNEVTPRDFSLDGPAPVLVRTFVKATFKIYRRLEVKREVALEAAKFTDTALREVNIQDGIARVELELVVTGKALGWLEEELENVVEPKVGVVLGLLRKKVMVLHSGEKVQVVPVPTELGGGRGEWLALGGVLVPRPPKGTHARGILPSGIVALAVDYGRNVSPTTNTGLTRLGVDSTEE
jgi:hypothetical protein